jgi:hypothetical protein
MKNVYLWVLIFFLLFPSSFLISQSDDRDIDSAKGGYTKCSVFVYKFQYGELSLKSKQKYRFSKFNNKGLPIEVVKYYYYNKGPDGIRVNIKYDDRNNKIEENSYEAKKHTSRKVYKYDDKGNRIEELTFTPNGTLYDKNIYRYDDKRNKIEEVNYGVSGSISDRKTFDPDIDSKLYFEYDNKGRKIKTFDTLESGSGWLVQTFEYDEKDRLIEKITYDDYEGYLYKIVKFKYDVNMNIVEVEKKQNIHGVLKLTFKETYQYDFLGNLIEKIDFDERNEPFWKYEYIYSK